MAHINPETSNGHADCSAPTPTSTAVQVTHLQSDSELPAWLNHCEASFRRKGTPRHYFEQHWLCDPHRDLSNIVVAKLSSSQQVVSSCRVYRRNIHIAQQALTVGGIGEVGTHPQHEKQGLAKLCMNEASRNMSSHGISLSVLHSSQPPIQCYYTHTLQYTSVPLHYTILPTSALNVRSQALQTMKPTINGAMLQLSISDLFGSSSNGSNYLREIQEVYSTFSSQFNGTVQRTADYWQQWIHNALVTRSQSLPTTSHLRVDVFRIMAGKIGAYMISEYRSYNDSDGSDQQMINIIEYGHHMLSSELAAMVVCSVFIERAVKQFSKLQPSADQSEDVNAGMLLRCPVPLLHTLAPTLPPPNTVVDAGMMYKVIEAAADEQGHHEVLSPKQGTVNGQTSGSSDAHTDASNGNHTNTTTGNATTESNFEYHTFSQWQAQTVSKPVARKQLLDIMLEDPQNTHICWQLDAF